VNVAEHVPAEPVVHDVAETVSGGCTINVIAAPETRLLFASRAVTTAVYADSPSAGTGPPYTVHDELAATAGPATKASVAAPPEPVPAVKFGI
jgi:hypothetical protein